MKKIIVLLCISAFISMQLVQAEEAKNKNDKKAAGNKVLKENKFGKYWLENNTGVFKADSGNFQMTVTFDNKEQVYIMEMIGKTSGWISVGFGQTEEMMNAEIMIGYIKDNKPFLEHHFATGPYSHKPISEIDKSVQQNILKILSAKEENGTTVIRFTRPLASQVKEYKKFQSGLEINFMYGLGPKDNFKTKHFERGYLKIQLP